MYKRVLLKLSGESLHDEDSEKILSVEYLNQFSNVISELHKKGLEVCVVIGAGNIWRGKLASQIGIEAVPADYMGMLGTVINAVALSSSLRKTGLESVVFSAVSPIEGVTRAYDIEEADKAMKEGKVAFLSGGTGKPFFTTDTAAAMRAVELNCDVVLMGKNGVEGIYDKDPTLYEDAKFFPEITYKEILERKLQVMDLSAVELIKDTNIIIRVFSMANPNNFISVVNGSTMGTTCHKGE